MAAVEDGLERLGGVHSFRVDLQTNLVTLHCGPATAVDLRSVPLAIREAGFRPDDLRIAGRGEIDAAAATFTPKGWASGVALAPTGEGVRASGAVRLEGRIEGWSEPGAELTLHDVRVQALR